MWGHLSESPEGGLRRSNKRQLFLLGGLGFFLLFAIGTLTLGIVAKLTADSAAHESRAAVIAYLDDTIMASKTSSDPQSILTALGRVHEPVLKNVQLGDISPDYRNAKKLHEAATAKVNEFTKKINGYAQTLEFYSSYQKLKTQIRTLEATNPTPGGKTKDIVYLEKYYGLLKDTNSLIKKTTVASDYSNEFVELGRVYSSMELNMEAITTAIKQGNDLAFSNMSETYSMAAAQIPRVETSLGAYNESVPARVSAARDELIKYRAEL